MELQMGRTIQHLRKLKNLTQEQTARALGVSTAAVSKWETNSAYPDITLLSPLARLLGVDVDTLLNFHPVLTQEECMLRMKKAEDFFQERQSKQAIDYCENLLKQYPNDLFLKFRVASAYMMFMSVEFDEVFMENQLKRSILLFEESSKSAEQEIREASYHVLSGLYMMNQETEKALYAVEQLPQPDYDARIMKSGILYESGKVKEAEKLDQKCLYGEISNADLNLISLAKIARKEKEYERALRFLDMAQELDRLFHMDDIGAMKINYDLTRAEILCEMGRIEEAAAQIESMGKNCLELLGREELKLPPCFDKLEIKENYPEGKAYLLENEIYVLEQMEGLDRLKDRTEYKQVLQSLKNAAAKAKK